MMRFRKGTIVDVLDRRDDPSGVWRPAKIISGNGHYYSVRYDCSVGTKDRCIGGKVSRKAIRPCPPPVDGIRGWVTGDLVEVYDDCAWKAARILKGVGGNCYEIMLLGSLKEFRVCKVNIRDRQLWQDEKWIIIGKGLGICRNVKSRKTATENSFQKITFPLQQANPNTNVQPRHTRAALDNTVCRESHIVSAKILKRASPCFASHVDTEGGFTKIRAVEKERECQKVRSGCPVSFFEKGQSWRHACLASKDLKIMLGLAIFSWCDKWVYLSSIFYPQDN